MGDTVTITLRATAEDEIIVQPDVNDILASVPGATNAFSNLAPSHRREWLRFIDDARTPATRSRRIRQTIDDLLHRPKESRPARGRDRALWTCPKWSSRATTAVE